MRVKRHRESGHLGLGGSGAGCAGSRDGNGQRAPRCAVRVSCGGEARRLGRSCVRCWVWYLEGAETMRA